MHTIWPKDLEAIINQQTKIDTCTMNCRSCCDLKGDFWAHKVLFTTYTIVLRKGMLFKSI